MTAARERLEILLLGADHDPRPAPAAGLIARSGKARGDEKPEPGTVGSDEPLAEWEQELLAPAESSES